jgi:hypothetical protein
MRTEQTFKASSSEIVNPLIAKQVKSNRDNFDRLWPFGMRGRRVRSLESMNTKNDGIA